MKKPMDKPKLLITIAALITGFLLMVSFRHYYNSAARAQKPHNQQLIAYIDNLEEEINSLEEEIIEAREKIDSIQKEQTEGEYVLAGLNKSLESLKNKAGLTQVTGPGVVLTLDDNNKGAEIAKKNNPETYYPENYIIHSTDILYLINAVAKEAEAISVNNQRIVDISNIRCVGTVILVNSARLAPPYDIKIIGSPSGLELAITESYHYSVLASKEMPMKLIKVEEQTLPPFTGSYATEYTQIPKEEPGEEAPPA